MSSTGTAGSPPETFEEFVETLEAALPALPKQEAKLAHAMLLSLDTLGLETGKSLAMKVGVTEVTVGRLLRRLGCDGMRELKRLVRLHYSVTGAMPEGRGEVALDFEAVLEAEIASITSIFNETATPGWRQAVKILHEADEIHVTGFQSVQGIAEDCTRRLALVRPRVSYLSPHDNMLVEWLECHHDDKASKRCLILVDISPYAKEALQLVEIARAQGRDVIVISDEFCHWSRDVATLTINSPSRTGLFFESTLGILAALNLLIHETANAAPDRAQNRLQRWKENTGKIGLF